MPDTTPEATDASSTESSPNADSGSVSDAEPFSDPESLRDRQDVPFVEGTNVHDDRDHCATGVEGRAIVGVTDDAGAVLLAIHEEASVVMLPHGEVEAGDDWAAVGREAVELVTDVPFEIDGVEAVREVDHLVEGESEDEPHARTVNVLFHASLAGDRSRAADPGIDANDHWDADWFDAVPEELTDGHPLVAEDVGSFVD